MRFTKVLGFIDLLVQTILLGAILVMSGKLLFEEGWGAWGGMIFFAMIGAMFLGPWQMLSSIITTAARAPHFKLRAIHLVVSTLYIIIVLATDGFNGMNGDPFNSTLNPVFLIGTPALLAVFYYYITIRT
jgi:hypothetical protein